MDINLTNIVANSIIVDVNKGEITMNSATLAAASTSTITTRNGDVVFQSPSDFSVAWAAHTNYYCLGAPNGGLVNPISGPLNCFDLPANNAHSASTDCTATY